MLRHVLETDLLAFFQHQQDPEAAAMALANTREWDAFVEHWHNVLANDANVARTVVVDGRAAGYVASWDGDGRRLVGYWIGREYWGRGIAARALHEFLEGHEARRPIHAFVAQSNTRSMRVLEKCGFHRAGEPEVAPDGVIELLFVLDSPVP